MIWLLISAVIGCDIPYSADGYSFGKKEFEHLNPDIVFVVHSSEKELHEAAKAHGVKHIKSTKAFSILHPPSYHQCSVHILDPKTHYYPEYIGHEITHCMYGRWHN